MNMTARPTTVYLRNRAQIIKEWPRAAWSTAHPRLRAGCGVARSAGYVSSSGVSNFEREKIIVL